MGRIRIAQARPGQIVAKDISDSKGNVLLRANTELTGDSIGRLVRRGIGSIDIKEGDDAAPPLTPDQIQARLGELVTVLHRQFDGTLQNPLMASLLEAAKRYHAGKVE